MSIEEFGKQLLETLDLDPVYVGLYGLGLNGKQMARWLVSYWCFYSVGSACYMSEQSDEKCWDLMLEAAQSKGNDPWPRGTERRHFRGTAAVTSVTSLMDQYKSPWNMVYQLYSNPTHEPALTVSDVFNRVKAHNGFGPWIAFKVCDMLERVVGIRMLGFEDFHLGVFKDPVEGARRCAERWGWKYSNNQSNDQLRDVINVLKKQFKSYKAPPRFDRPIGLQEAETILCKWKSHLNGHYPMGKDTKEIIHTLEEWSDRSKTALRFKRKLEWRQSC